MARCVLVLGVGCSGTSATAGALHHLGCPMGRESHLSHRPEHYEDRCFYEQFHATQDDVQHRTHYRLLFKRHRIEPIWGFKNTLTYKALPWLLDAIRDWGDDPYCVAVHRTFGASIKGRMQGKCGQYIGEYADSEANFFTRPAAEVWGVEALAGYWQALAGVVAQGAPLYHVSFEYLVTDPGWEIARLARFAFDGLEDRTPEQFAAAVGHIDIEMVHN